MSSFVTRKHLSFSKKRSKLGVTYCFATFSYLHVSMIFVKGFQMRRSRFIFSPQLNAREATAVDATDAGGHSPTPACAAMGNAWCSAASPTATHALGCLKENDHSLVSNVKPSSYLILSFIICFQ